MAYNDPGKGPGGGSNAQLFPKRAADIALLI